MNKNPLIEMAEYAGARALDWRAHAASAGKATNRHSRSMTLCGLRMADIDDREARILRAAAAVIQWIQENPERIPAALDNLIDDFDAACKEVPK